MSSLRISALGVCLVLGISAISGCGSNNTAILPTDEKSKELANKPPPPIVGMGAAGAAGQAPVGNAKRPGGKK